MNPKTRHGRNTAEQQLDDARLALELMHHELGRLEREHERYRLALRRIAAAESGHWGVIAHEALRVPELEHLEGE